MFKKSNVLIVISVCMMFTGCFDLNDLETGMPQEIEISAHTVHELLEAVHKDSLKIDKSMTTCVPEKYITDTEAKVIFISENQEITFLYKRTEKGEWKQSDLIQTTEIIKSDLQTSTRSDYGHLVTLKFTDNTTTERIPIDDSYLDWNLWEGECFMSHAFLNDGFKEISGATFHEKDFTHIDTYGATWKVDIIWDSFFTEWFSWSDSVYYDENPLILDTPTEDLDIVCYILRGECTEPPPEPVTPEPTPSPTPKPPDSLIIDLVNDTYRCPPGYLPHIDFILEPTDHKTVLKITFTNPDEYVSGNNYRAALFDIEYGGQPYQWTVNIGDSQSNDGGGGDAGHQSNDAEMQIGGESIPGSTIYAEGNDDIPLEDKVLLNEPDFVRKGDKISLRVENNYLKWENKTKGTSNSLYSEYLYALDGQPDSEGPVNYDMYAAFNRVIGTSSRNGSGVTKVTITFQSETPPTPTPKPPVVNYTIYNPTYPDDILDVMMEINGVPGWSDSDWEIEFYCNYVINDADALYGCKLSSCTLEEDYTHKVIRGKGDTKKVAPRIFLEVRADSYFGFSGFKVNGIQCEGKRVTEVPAIWQQIAYQGSPGAYGKIIYAIPRVYNMPGWCDGKWRMDITFNGTVNEILEVTGKGIYDWNLTNQLHIWGDGEPEYMTITTDYDYAYCPQFRSVSVNGESAYVDIYTNPWHDYAGCCGEYR